MLKFKEKKSISNLKQVFNVSSEFPFENLKFKDIDSKKKKKKENRVAHISCFIIKFVRYINKLIFTK